MVKKSLIASAVLAGISMAASVAHAQSSVQFSGLADMYLGSMRFAGDAARKNTVGNSGMTTSWIGVRGSEDIGNGMKVGFAMTSFLRMSNGDYGRFPNDTFWSRDANVSLSGGFGTVVLGRWLAPNFLPTVLFNPFGDSFTFSPLVLHANVPLFNGTNWVGTTPADTGWSSQVAYTTPDFGGLKGTLQYQFRDGAATGKNWGGNLIYMSGPLGLTAFYERAQLTNPVAANYADGSTRTNWMLGGSYDLTAVKLFLTYGQSKNDVSSAKLKTAQVGASMPVGPGKVLASYAQTRNSLLDAKRQTLTVGYDYNLSKRTDVYANVMHDRITNRTSGTSVGVGLRHRF